MPELAEVEYARRLLANAILQRCVTSVHVDSTSNTTIFKGNLHGAESVKAAMEHTRCVALKRKGKNLVWFALKEKKNTLAVINFHFGMKGLFNVHAPAEVREQNPDLKPIYYMSGKRKNWLPEKELLAKEEEDKGHAAGAGGGKGKATSSSSAYKNELIVKSQPDMFDEFEFKNEAIGGVSKASTTTSSAVLGGARGANKLKKQSSDNDEQDEKNEADPKMIAANPYLAPEDNFDSWPPKHHKILFDTERDGVKLAFVDSRKFAKIVIHQEIVVPPSPPGVVPKDDKQLHTLIDNIWSGLLPDLAPDPLTDMPSAAEFDAKVQKLFPADGRNRLNIKQTLLDQSKLVCGIGNWLVDDILYDCAIHPQKATASLSALERQSLWASIKKICELACNHANADSTLFPRHWLFHVRWNARPGKICAKRPHLQLLELGGRSTVIDPKKQVAPADAVDLVRKVGETKKEVKIGLRMQSQEEEKSQKGGAVLKRKGKMKSDLSPKSSGGKGMKKMESRNGGKPKQIGKKTAAGGVVRKGGQKDKSTNVVKTTSAKSSALLKKEVGEGVSTAPKNKSKGAAAATRSRKSPAVKMKATKMSKAKAESSAKTIKKVAQQKQAEGAMKKQKVAK
eukprot:g638.t1